MRLWQLGVAAALGATLSCCGPSAEQQEARRMVADLERLRDAADGDRLALLVELERARPSGAQAERARASCTEAYRALHESTELEASVRKSLGGPPVPGSSAGPVGAPTLDAATVETAAASADAGSRQLLGADTDRIVADLRRAERELERAKKRMPECDQALASLRMLARDAARR